MEESVKLAIMKKEEKGEIRKPYKKTIANNPRARHEYLIEDTIESGIVLSGSEVKSLRTRSVSFADCYACSRVSRRHNAAATRCIARNCVRSNPFSPTISYNAIWVILNASA